LHDVPPLGGVAGHERYHNLGHRPDQLLQVENIEPGNPVRADITRWTADGLVATGAKRVLPVGMRARTGQQHNPYALVLARIGEGLDHFSDGFRPEGIALLRPVDRHLRDATGLMVEDVGEGSCALPFGNHGPNLHRQMALVEVVQKTPYVPRPDTAEYRLFRMAASLFRSVRSSRTRTPEGGRVATRSANCAQSWTHVCSAPCAAASAAKSADCGVAKNSSNGGSKSATGRCSNIPPPRLFMRTMVRLPRSLGDARNPFES